MKTIAALTFVLLLAAPARAIELSLEENRAERGSVGYVDMQRLFSASPDAQRAKEGFEELVRQAEERVNLRKAEILKLRQQLEEARAARAVIASSAAAVPPPAPPAETPAAVPPPAPAPAAAVSTAPAPAAASKTAAMALPGMTAPDSAPGAPPAASTASSAGLDALLEPQAAKSTAAPAAASPAAAAGMFPAPPPAAPAAAPAPSGPTVGQSLLELDAKIIQLESDVARKEAELTREHDEADHGLLDVESRKTDQVLARLYRALVEVSRREGVSVVVDKTTILYGHPAVDLTDRVLKYLREQP